MSKTTIATLPDPSVTGRRLQSNLPRGGFSPDPLTGVIREGARKLIEQAIEAELAALRSGFADDKLEDGRARLVRHGHLPEREVLSPAPLATSWKRSRRL